MPTNVKLENKSARILHINLGGGKNVAVPPTEGGITVKMSDREKEAFDRAVATDAVQGWITAGDLVVGEAEDDEPTDDDADDLEVDDDEDKP